MSMSKLETSTMMMPIETRPSTPPACYRFYPRSTGFQFALDIVHGENVLQPPAPNYPHIPFLGTSQTSRFYKMSALTNKFLTLIPAAHRVHVTSPITVENATSDEAVVPVLQKTRRSSSSASAESNSAAEEPALPSDIVESPVESVKRTQTEQVVTHQFLRLGN
ncbi:hypothetical protein AYO20_09318 [Fonsecaea nubica]|uniref:Uncharacterized protein n=1 Tax=Fonsecaea nubica TaxID=856822 RepID=A0A178CJC4_9EURO|nr:hypothetical protein AYO20_09318 [Fonsecaea nubica]OAL29165.1 hypothetical protein AYO20_09318 [Fonsecaea nubica]